jgi:hypothetical protein
MADDRVDVVFGARIGELIAGVAEAKEAIEGLRAGDTRTSLLRSLRRRPRGLTACCDIMTRLRWGLYLLSVRGITVARPAKRVHPIQLITTVKLEPHA